MPRPSRSLPRLEDLARTFRIAVDLAAAHLQAAGMAKDNDDEPHAARLVTLARRQLAIAVDALGDRHRLLEPLTARQGASERQLFRAIGRLRALADEICPADGGESK